jgi:hypothetical protein
MKCVLLWHAIEGHYLDNPSRRLLFTAQYPLCSNNTGLRIDFPVYRVDANYVGAL